MVTMVYLRTILGIDDVFSLTVDYCGINRVRASSGGVRTADAALAMVRAGANRIGSTKSVTIMRELLGVDS